MQKLLVKEVENGSTTRTGVRLTHVALDARDPGMNQLQAPPTDPSLPLLDVHGAWPMPHLFQVALKLPLACRRLPNRMVTYYAKF